MKTSLSKWIYPLITIFVLLGLIQVVSIIKNEPLVFPSVISIFKSFINLFKKDTLIKILYTLFRVIISVLISFVLAFIIGLLYIWNDRSYLFFKPLISLMRSTPLAIISIFLFILLDSTIAPFVITFLVILPIATESILSGIKNIDPVLKDDLALLNTNLFKSYIYVYIPLIKPILIMTFIQIFGLGLKVMVMGEFICYTKMSIGKELSILKSSFDISSLLAYGILIVIIVSITELIVNVLMNKIEKKKIKEYK